MKVDVAYSRNPVKILGVSGGIAYGALGATHHSLHDIAVLRAFPGMNVVLPSDGNMTEKLVKMLVDYPEPVFVRVGRGATGEVYENHDFDCIPGKANLLHEGKDITIIATGETVYHALKAAEMLEEKKINARVLDYSWIKPFDKDALRKAAEETGCIVTVEEHSIYGGLGALVTEELSEKPVPVKILALPDEDMMHGTSKELFAYYGIDAEGITKSAEKFFRANKPAKA